MISVWSMFLGWRGLGTSPGGNWENASCVNLRVVCCFGSSTALYSQEEAVPVCGMEWPTWMFRETSQALAVLASWRPG